MKPATSTSAQPTVAHDASRSQRTGFNSRRHSSFANAAVSIPTPTAGAKKFSKCQVASIGPSRVFLNVQGH